MTKKRIGGFTLIELIVGTGVLAVISTLVIGIWLGGVRNFTNFSFTQARDSAFFDAFNRIDAYVRVAKAFPTTYTDPATNTVYNASNSVLIMSLNSITSSGGNNCDYTDYIVITYSGTTVTERVFADANSARRSLTLTLARNISAATFVQNKVTGKHRTVAVTMTSQQAIDGRTVTSTHTQTMTARND